MGNQQEPNTGIAQEPNTQQEPNTGIIQEPKDEVMDDSQEAEESQEPNTI